MKSYLRHGIHNVVDVKELIALEHLDFEGRYKEYVEKHDFWEICYVEKGEITLSAEGKNLNMREGQLALISPNKRHSYISEKGNDSRAYVICFESFSNSLKPLGERIFWGDSLQTDCINRIKDECSHTFKMNESDQLEVLTSPIFGGQQAILSQLEYLLICLIRSLSGENSGIEFLKQESFYEDLTDAVIRYLRENVDKKIYLDEVCRRFNYSRSFLCKTFKEQTGATLIEYLNRLKIEEAKRRLTETTATVTGIATSLGFSELKYFNVVFKKQVGMTPLEYRERIQKG